jgi:hypothetical protein
VRQCSLIEAGDREIAGEPLDQATAEETAATGDDDDVAVGWHVSENLALKAPN